MCRAATSLLLSLARMLLEMDYVSLVCCTVAFLLYCNTLDSEFVYDDRRAILTNPDLQPKTPWSQLLENDYWGTPLLDPGSHGSYRPLSVLTFRLNYLASGFTPWSYHLVNVFLHCSATYLLIKVARTVLPKNKERVGSIVTGALFAAHPVHTEAVASVVGRADLLACNLFFLSLLAYSSHVTHRDSICCSNSYKPPQKRYEKIATSLQKTVTSCNWPKNKTNHERILLDRWCCWVTPIKIWWYISVCLVLAVCAMLSKETGITVLGVSFVYDFVYSRNQKKKQKRSFLILSIALLLILAARLQTKTPRFSTADNPTAREPSSTTRFMTLSYLPALNFLMLLYPSALSFDWGMDAVPKIQSVRDPRVFFTLCFYAALAVVLGVVLCAVLDRRGWFEVDYKPGCTVCHRRNSSDSHSHHCRITNNNNTPFQCPCPTPKPQKITSKDATLFALSLIILPFLPASNLFFYVGFVVAERVLYIPSAGFCLLLGIAGARLWKTGTKREYLCTGFVLVLTGFSAKTFMRNRDWSSEETLYRSAVPYNPPKAYGNLGSILNSKGRVEEAEQAFRKALEYRPNMADVHYNLAILLQSQQKLDEAIQSYQRAIHFRPSLALAYVNLGTALIATGKCEEAIAILRQASKLDGTGLKDRREHENAKVSALLQLGALYSDQGRLQNALAVYREAADGLPQHYPPQINAMANRAAGKGYENEAYYENIKFHFLGVENIHVMRNSLLKVVETCEQKNPTMSSFLSGLESSGWVRHIKSILDISLFIAEALEEGISVVVHCSDGWDRTTQVCSIASILLDPYYRTISGYQALIEKDWLAFGHKFSDRCGHVQTDSKEISPVFTQLLDATWQLMQQFPCSFQFNETFLLTIHDHVHSCQYGTFVGNCEKDRIDLRFFSLFNQASLQKVYNVLGETLAKMQLDEEAEKWYRAALEAEPDHVPAHITYGKLLAKNVSRSAEAEQWFRRAQRLAPHDASVYHHYGAFLVINRRYSEAASMYERAAELSPEDFELAVAAATAMRKAGLQEDAERWYRKSVRMKPTDPRGHTNLGAMLHLNGKYKEAEHSYKKALRLQPDDETTLTNLHRLYGIMT